MADKNKKLTKDGVRRRRARGSGSIIAKNGRWVLRWRDEGRLHQEATDCRVDRPGDRKRAEALLEERTRIGRLKERRDQIAVLLAERAEIEDRIRELESLAADTPPPLTLGGLVQAWRDSPRRRDCSDTQRERYAAQIGAFVQWAGESVEMSAVDDAMAERYAAELARRSSGSTYNKHINALDACWRAVGRTASAAANPWADLPRRRLDAHTRRVLTPEEISRILEIAEGEVRSLVLVGLRTGLRMGDACRLRWEAFGPDSTLEVVTGKTGALVRLPGARLLAELTGGGRHPARGEIMPRLAALYRRDNSALPKVVRRTFERAGIATRVKRDGWCVARPDASYHSLRHTFVTRAIEAGVPAAIVRALVGHTRETMTEHYTHVGAAAIAEAFGRAGI